MSCGTLNVQSLSGESFWTDKARYDAAELCLASISSQSQTAASPNKQDSPQKKESKKNVQKSPEKGSIAGEIARARQHIKNTLQSDSLAVKEGVSSDAVSKQIASLAAENKRLTSDIEQLRSNILKLENRIVDLEKRNEGAAAKPVISQSKTVTSEPASVRKEDDDDEDIDLFGSDDDEAEKERLHQERLNAYEEKKSKKPALIAKSNIILDVKPWDDETDMKAMEERVRSIQMAGLIWGASKLVPLAYGIHKLQISCVVEDDIVSVDILQEQIEGFEDLVQSVDIAAFNKV